MLSNASHHSRPFSCFRCEQAFDPAQCALLDALFVVQGGWQARDDSFYSCFLREVTAELPASLLVDVRARMRTITGLALADDVVVTAQRMEPGQAVGVHSDQPWLGYEVARLVVQLNADWQRENGGALELYESLDGAPVERIEPAYNAAFGFLLHEGSYHGVSKVSRTRRTVVFNFWHVANTPQLADAVAALFADMHFSELPAALDPIAVSAETHLPEDTTFRASLAALALRRWGYDDETVVDGYRASASLSSQLDVIDERTAAIRLAAWVAHLKTGTFDLPRWQELQGALAGTGSFPRLMPLWGLCLGASS